MGAVIVVTGPHPNGYLASIAGQSGLGYGPTAILAVANVLARFSHDIRFGPLTVIEIPTEESIDEP